MKTKILIAIIITVIIIAGGVFIFWYIKTHQCPEFCDDKNACTEDSCSKQTNYKCQHDFINDCCGNTKCEISELYESCPADCPDCDDNNKCTADSYDYHEQKCANKPILEVICCGNSVCEPGETYQTCAGDCPNCDDNNQCTKDSYEYHQKKCLNEIIIPCCGNRVCDKGAETRSNCSADCPNCDDNNRLTADSFNYTIQKCENIVTHYFIDDFESGTQNWNFGGDGGTWVTTKDGANTIFKGVNHNWSELQGKGWDNYSLKVRFKIIKGGQHFNYRIKQEEGNPTRYFIYLGNGSINISKQIKESFFSDLARADNLSIGSGWHNIEIRGYGNIINVFVDGVLLIKYKDTNNPVLSGVVGFETMDNSEVWIDDVEIKVIAPKDIVYP